MPTEVIMPALGMSQETGRLLAWLKKEGESVTKGDILMEIETDKTTVELEATASGTLMNVTAEEGADVPVGSVIALIVASGETPPPPATNGQAKAPEPARAANDDRSTNDAVTVTPVARRVAEDLGIDIKQVPTQGKRLTRADVEAFANDRAPSTTGGMVLASPKARRLAQENGLNIKVITGSGPQGAVLANDVLEAAQSAPAQVEVEAEKHVAAPARTTSAATGTMWRRMAERLAESWQTVPHFYLKRDVDVSELVNWRQRILDRTGEKVTYTDLLVKLVAAALRRHPHVNGQWTGSEVVFNDSVNIGLAVAVDEGLIVPVIHSADTIGVSAISERRKQVVDRAQRNRMQPADLQGGTFTISNLGMFGIDEFSAIVNPPEAAILAVGRISDRIVPVNGEAVIRPMMTLSLSCDHRAVDGARGAQFMDTLSQYIADPLSLMD